MKIKHFCFICIMGIAMLSCGHGKKTNNDSTASEELTSFESSSESVNSQDSSLGVDTYTMNTVNEDGSIYVNDSSKLKQGIVGKIVYPCEIYDGLDNCEYTLFKNHKICKGECDGYWEKEGSAIVIFTGEGTSYITILNGYVYDGCYDSKTGLCSFEDWNEKEEGLVDSYYRPTPSKGVKLTSFEIYTPELK